MKSAQNPIDRGHLNDIPKLKEMVQHVRGA